MRDNKIHVRKYSETVKERLEKEEREEIRKKGKKETGDREEN